MRTNEDVFRDRKASRLAGAWIAAGYDAATLERIVSDACIGTRFPAPANGADWKAARATLELIVQTASAIAGRQVNPPSLTTWYMVVAKVKAQELVSA